MHRFLLTLVALVMACGDGSGASGEATEGFVGDVSGTDAFIAIVAGEAQAMAYVCNGQEEIFEWFEGALADPDTLELDNGAGGMLGARRVGAVFEGEIVLSDGSEHSFTAELAAGEAGLYRVLGEEAASAEIKAGWIVNNRGEQRGALLRSSAFEPAPALPDDGLRVDGVTYPVFKIQIDPRPPSPPAGPIPVPYPITGTVAR